MQGLAQCEFEYKGNNYKKKRINEISLCQVKKTLGQ
ncbi:hypothetical protein Gotur_032157 [Gossypium turneri]